MRIVFMGTPDFAGGILTSLLDAGENVIAVYTQPDRPQGRKAVMTPPPVKVIAESHGIPVYQPVRIRRDKWVRLLEEQKPDVMVVAAFGQILPKQILDIAPCVNVHASLLPRYRGSSPIQRAIAAGDRETGVTIMRLDEGMDTGNILHKEIIPIRDTDTGETLFDRLEELGRKALRKVLDDYEAGKDLVGVPQDPEFATYAPMLTREDGRLDFTRSAWLLDCQIRAFTPWPSTYTIYEGKVLKILAGRIFRDSSGATGASAAAGADDAGRACGTVLTQEEVREAGGNAGKQILVQTGDGLLELLTLQLPGKKPLPADVFLRGCPLWGKTLGLEQ